MTFEITLKKKRVIGGSGSTSLDAGGKIRIQGLKILEVIVLQEIVPIIPVIGNP